MRINVDRLCELAGVPGSRRTRGGLIRESADHSAKEEYGHMEEMPKELEQALDEMDHGLLNSLDEEEEKEKKDSYDKEKNEGSYAYEGEGAYEGAGHDHDPMEEMIDINEADLVKELRRMRVKMYEQRKIQKRRQQNLQEAQLKAIIDQEVKNVLKELNLNSGWVYGNKKPTRSRRGYTHQGSFLKGFGFK